MNLTPKVDKKTLKAILSSYYKDPDKCYQAIVLFCEITALDYGREIVRESEIEHNLKNQHN